ncbi:Electron transport complex subunit RsxB [bioreactor metagenome]|uniref:Electron transport complex subunit RsxB n=1 Tax=bioreactor metagenome TaxID=1076179 RepID=A0A644YPE1_9ZZZZ
MRVAVLSGKGGTGKTFVSVNLAAAAGNAAYIDCDVEEPNGRLFLKPRYTNESPVYTLIPEFDTSKCTGCRKCVEFCRYNALVFVREKPMVFSEVCHSCGGCVLVCPEGAVSEKPHSVGLVEEGAAGSVRVVTGIMDTGEVSAVPVIKAALRAGTGAEELTVIDCPPGSGCPVMESVMDANYCILVTEPTTFGFHNFQMVHKLVTLLGKPCGVVVNKADEVYAPLEEFCTANRTPVLLRIPYRAELARLGAVGQIAAEQDEEIASLFRELLTAVQKETVR